GVGRGLAQAGDARLQARQGIEQMLVVAADRIPEITDARGTAHRGAALAADPDRRIRPLDGLGLEHDAVEARVAPGKAWRGFGPQYAEGVDVLVGHRAAFGKGRR